MKKILNKDTLYKIGGWLLILLLWFIVSNLNIINNKILPTPQETWRQAVYLYNEKNLLFHTWFSVKINLFAYFKAILGALIFGFSIGLFPKVRKLLSQQIDALRFTPITALMGIFITMYGLTVATKINFLAFGIWVYLTPVVVQRIDEAMVVYVNGVPNDTVHMQMAKTLGATFWQKVRYVVWPAVSSRLFKDIGILVGISWTYIIVAELAGIQGGLGSLIYLGQRSAIPGIVYAIIIEIIIIGLLQDLLFRLLDRLLFRFKYS
jgi:NitT/TauT family transport system permease protein